MRVPVVLLVAMTLCGLHLAGQDAKAVPDWRAVAQKHGFSDADLEQLASQKFLITNETFAQVFTPYIKSDVPVFVTADALLNAYCVNLEATIVQLERANARNLPPMLGRLLDAVRAVQVQTLDDKMLDAAVQDARRRAEFFLGVGLALLGSHHKLGEPGLDAMIESEVRRVEKAEGAVRPKWKRDNVPLDYTTFKPRGFYLTSGRLQRYFRAVRWLQLARFRIDRDDDLLAASIIASALCPGRCGALTPEQREDRGLIRFFRQMVGAPDRPDLVSMADWVRYRVRCHGGARVLVMDRANLDAVRRRAEWRFLSDPPLINDGLALPPDDPTKGPNASFGVLSPARIPDGVLFEKTTNTLTRPLPDGLEVCAALGSGFASERLLAAHPTGLLSTIKEHGADLLGESHYQRFFSCLAALLEPPDPRAPALFGSEAWAIKSCQTALAGWAQLRHCWVLQGQGGYSLLGDSKRPPGFVEPCPRFYGRLADLCRDTIATIEPIGVVRVGPADRADRLRTGVGLLEKCGWVEGGEASLKDLSRSEQTTARQALFRAVSFEMSMYRTEDPRQQRANQLTCLRQLATQLEAGEFTGRWARSKSWLGWMLETVEQDVATNWRKLEALSRRVQAIANKQLDQSPFDEDDRRFLVDFGHVLGNVMGYHSNSYLTPHDDAPRIVDVFTDGTRVRPLRVLHVGIARSRAIYVLYPWGESETLCRGAILPYYEFTHAGRLGNTEWMKLLDSSERPRQPAWIGPVVTGQGIGNPQTVRTR